MKVTHLTAFEEDVYDGPLPVNVENQDQIINYLSKKVFEYPFSGSSFLMRILSRILYKNEVNKI